jgi:hypothetical protein
MTLEVIDAPRQSAHAVASFASSLGRCERLNQGAFPMNAIVPAPFLRQALLSDAVTSGACAMLMLFGAGFLAPLLGLPMTLLQFAGLVLIPYAAWLGSLGLRERMSRPAVWAVIIANAIWAADSILLLVSGWVHPTPAGYAFVLAQAAVVAMYAELQFVGLRRSTAVHA